jgi:hypothetical protein
VSECGVKKEGCRRSFVGDDGASRSEKAKAKSDL